MTEEEKIISELLPNVINRSFDILNALKMEMKEESDPLTFTISVNESGKIPLNREIDRIVTTRLIGVGEAQEKKWYVDSIVYKEMVKDDKGKIMKDMGRKLIIKKHL